MAERCSASWATKPNYPPARCPNDATLEVTVKYMGLKEKKRTWCDLHAPPVLLDMMHEVGL